VSLTFQITQFWVLLDNEDIKGLELRTYITFGTGHHIDEKYSDFEFVGTFLLNEGALVFHVFEGKGEEDETKQ